MTKKTSDDSLEPFFQMVKEGDLARVVEYIRHSHLQVQEIMDSVERTSKKSALHMAAGEGHT